MPENMEIWLRKEGSKKFETIELEPSCTVAIARRRLYERVRNRPQDFDWVGVRHGERVLLRGTRQEDGTFTWERNPQTQAEVQTLI